MPDSALRHEIAELVHRYSDAVTRRDLEQWASCWAVAGRWELRADRIASDPDGRIATLRQALEQLEGVVQVSLNGSVTTDGPDTASGRWYILETFRRVNGERVMLLAHYDDRYVRDEDGWRFAARTLVPHYQGPPDLTGVFLVRSS